VRGRKSREAAAQWERRFSSTESGCAAHAQTQHGRKKRKKPSRLHVEEGRRIRFRENACRDSLRKWAEKGAELSDGVKEGGGKERSDKKGDSASPRREGRTNQKTKKK